MQPYEGYHRTDYPARLKILDYDRKKIHRDFYVHQVISSKSSSTSMLNSF